MIRIVTIALTWTSCAIGSWAQLIGHPFPEMATRTADGVDVALPADVQGKYTLLLVAYSKKSEKELQSWAEPIFYKFIQKATGLMASFTYDINVYFVPMFTGVHAAAAEGAKKQALKKVDPRLLAHVVFYKGELGLYKDKLNLDKKDAVYLFALDPQGTVLEAVSGAYEEAKMNKIEAVIE